MANGNISASEVLGYEVLGYREGGRPAQPHPPVEMSEPYEVIIKKAINGYVCKVGCKTVVFETLEKMLKELERYYKNPMAVEKEYLEKK